MDWMSVAEITVAILAAAAILRVVALVRGRRGDAG
jgi:hypothetical protein